ncbi:MAG: PQQ-binding-like beta-propeller repeat protein [Acidobacteriia bacterium]|nr:PQQ-binding-like beta-propeller repeat protein [Terriglobia bacterium]
MRLLLLLAVSYLHACAEDWPQFRGPGGQGHSREAGLPFEWSETDNVRWKVALPGLGWSSPSIQGETIWLTTATEEGRSLRLLAVDRTSGAIRSNVEVFHLKGSIPVHGKNSRASPTPVVEGDRVYVHFGSYGTACVRTDGEILWRTQLAYDHRHGPGGSPALYKDLLLISCDGYDIQYVVALDKRTGEIHWKTARAGYQAYTTPLLITVNGRDQMISPGAWRAVAYDPSTGEEIWSVRYGKGYSNVPRAVFGHGLVYICTGFDQADLLAVRPTGSGDVTDTHVAWSGKRGIPLTPSPILVGDEIYFASDNGVATSLDAKTGKEHWRQRLGGNYSASPIYGDGRIFFLSEECVSTVIAPGQTYKPLAANRLDGRCLASPAVSGGAIFLRSDTHLYRLENR